LDNWGKKPRKRCGAPTPGLLLLRVVYCVEEKKRVGDGLIKKGAQNNKKSLVKVRQTTGVTIPGTGDKKRATILVPSQKRLTTFSQQPSSQKGRFASETSRGIANPDEKMGAT